MKIVRLGLFQHIYLRVIAIIAASLIMMLIFSHIHQSRALVDAWRQDLQQEAEWLAAHTQPETGYERIAAAWRSMHDGVRMRVYDAEGQLVTDSLARGGAHSGAPGAPNAYTIEVRTPLIHDPAGGELVLSRAGLSLFPNRMESGLAVTAIVLFLIAAGLLLPLTRRVTRTFERLSALAARVAEGQFGATIPEHGDRDLSALILSFNAMSRGLKDAEVRNRRLLVDVSHEFRSPLARLTALIDTLQRHPEESTELMARLRAELELLDRLTGDALTGARFTPSASQLQLEDVALASWADQAFARLSASDPGFSGRFITRNTADASLINIDPQRIMQVLGNLVDNARKALSGVDDGLIELEVEICDAWAVFRVRDNGSGIRDQDLPFIFDRFYRASQSDEDQGGAGLGLSIARELIVAHDGQLHIRSPIGEGVVAEIRLPIHRSEAR